MEYRAQAEENLIQRYTSFGELQNAKSKKVIGIAEHLKNTVLIKIYLIL